MLHRQRSCSSEMGQTKRGSLLLKGHLKKSTKDATDWKFEKLPQWRPQPSRVITQWKSRIRQLEEIKIICLTVPKYENCATVQNDHEIISGSFDKRDARSNDNKYATNKPPCANRHPDFANLYVFLFFQAEGRRRQNQNYSEGKRRPDRKSRD